MSSGVNDPQAWEWYCVHVKAAGRSIQCFQLKEWIFETTV